MADDKVIITNREIYDTLQRLVAKVDAVNHKMEVADATYHLRIGHLEARAGRSWQTWLAVAGSAVALPVSVWAALLGAS